MVYIINNLKVKSFVYNYNKKYKLRYFSGLLNHNHIGTNYEFLDCGDSKKLERFDKVIISRSCPTAGSWKPKLNSTHWNKANIIYEGVSGSAGNWKSLSDISDWTVNFKNEIKFSLQLSDLGQVVCSIILFVYYYFLKSHMLHILDWRLFFLVVFFNLFFEFH